MKHHQHEIIGIAGGLGPYAHIDLERKLLEAAQRLIGATGDQDYPEWVVSSVPATPDRTLALYGEAKDPVPALTESLRRLKSAGADFAVIACNTAHAYLEKIRTSELLPILDMITLTADYIEKRWPSQTIGILATTGALQSALYHNALRARGLEPVSLLDLPGGETLQERCVMAPIYGALHDGTRRADGIKAFGPRDEHVNLLETGARLLVEKGATVLIAGCTEIPLALTGDTVANVFLVDPARQLAESAIRRAYNLDKESSGNG